MQLLWIPFACGLVFPLLAWWLKRSMAEAKDPWGTLWCSNTAMVVVFAGPFLVLETRHGLSPNDPLWQPLLCGALFLIGQVTAFKSFAAGDLSLAVPLQGTKVLMVALMATVFFSHAPAWNIWLAAALTPVALFFLRDHAPGKKEERRHRATLWLATAAAAAFAGLDVGLEAWAAEWGVWRFGFWAFAFQALLSQAFLAIPGKRFRFGAGTWAKLAAGSLGLAVVTLALTAVIAASGAAAWTNILFNSRVLWSVLFVAVGARWLAGSEGSGARGRRFVRKRLVGAALMMATITLAVL